jgi:prevent-host-death family protein
LRGVRAPPPAADSSVLVRSALSGSRAASEARPRNRRELAPEPYEPYALVMRKKSYGADEARSLLPELLERAHHGKASIITKRGKPYAELVPVGTAAAGRARLPVLSLAGSGRGLWGRDSRRAVKRLRDEWQ